VTLFVVDASVVVKWVVEEKGTPEALALRSRAKLIAPDLLIAECANILWKKVARHELLKDEASIAAALLEKADIELRPMRSLLAAATRLAIELDHPAYDCLYLTAALESDCRMVTADERFLRKVGEGRGPIRDRAISLSEAANVVS
jgi:predicted nucleic acid-binding protein